MPTPTTKISPLSLHDALPISEDTALSFAASTLTTNDSPGPNESGQTLTVTAVTGNATTTHGTVELGRGHVWNPVTQCYHMLADAQYTVCDNGTAADNLCTTGT